MKTLHFILLPLLGLCLFACQNKTETTSVAPQVQVATAQEQANTLFIKKKCAVIVKPTASEIRALQQTEPDSMLDDVATDIDFTISIATAELQQLGITVMTTDKSKIVFKKADGTTTEMTRNRLGIGNNMVFFSPEKEPIITNPASFSDALPYLGVQRKTTDFKAGYWTTDRSLKEKLDTYVHTYFYNGNELFIKIVENGKMALEVQVADDDNDGKYTHPKVRKAFQFYGKDMTITEEHQQTQFFKTDTTHLILIH